MCCVRPGVREENASRFWLHRMLMAVDLPALERPAKATSGTSRGGQVAEVVDGNKEAGLV